MAFISTTAFPVRRHSPLSTFRTTKLSPTPLSANRKPPTASLLPTTQLLSSNPALLDSIATSFKSLNMPTWLVEWGHPAMMSFMVLGMGLPSAALGWQGRQNPNKKEGVQQKTLHKKAISAFFVLAILGGSGGTLSVAMQGFDIWQSPHFVSAVVCLSLLALNGALALSGFTIGSGGSGKAKQNGRKVHAYFGIAAMAAFFVHGVLGANILLG